MRPVVIGGKLQGLEVIYLAKKAGFTTTLIDKRKGLPAGKLCDEYIQYTFSHSNYTPELTGDMPDLIIPALENIEALEAAKLWAESINVPFAFDVESFRLSNSKNLSNKLFSELNLPVPKLWPDCDYPLIIKPDSESGSKDVVIVNSQEELHNNTNPDNPQHVIQEYVEGPSYSIEVIGRPGDYSTIQTTDLGMDELYDCCRIEAPTGLNKDRDTEFHRMVVTIAEKLQLHGIMDLEVIDHNHTLKIIEIDARFPSQTPIAVYWSTGINMVKRLADLFLGKEQEQQSSSTDFVILEHIHVTQSGLKVCGEHIMADGGPLELIPDFFGADEALTSYSGDSTNWVATMIFQGSSRDEVDKKRMTSYTNINTDILSRTK